VAVRISLEVELHAIPIMSILEPQFEVWKQRLREDCRQQDKLIAFENLGDECLRLLWEDGIEPSVQAITAAGKKAA
jgi:hypothetical protein